MSEPTPMKFIALNADTAREFPLNIITTNFDHTYANTINTYFDEEDNYIGPEYENVVFFHYPCWDGLMGAYLFDLHNPNTIFLPCNYTQEKGLDQVGYNKITKLHIYQLIHEKNVVIIDFSFKYSVIFELKSLSKTFQCFDHHNNVDDNVKGLINFDNTQSGAMQAFNNFKLSDRDKRIWRPFVKIVDAFDRYDWSEIPKEEALTYRTALNCLEMTFESLGLIGSNTGALYDQGTAIQLYAKQLQNQHINKMQIVLLDGIQIPIVECTVYDLISPMLNTIAETHPSGMAISWSWNSDKQLYTYSVRSVNGKAGDFCKRRGGGGHDNAAGFSSISWLIKE